MLSPINDRHVFFVMSVARYPAMRGTTVTA
jgi:hypothetical protein